MQPADLNLTSTVTGHQLFLFVSFAHDGADPALAQSVDRLGDRMENMPDISGHPSEDAFKKGQFQFLRAETGLTKERDLPNPGMSKASGLIRLEAASLEPLLQYERELRGLIESRGGAVENLTGVQRPRSYTSYAMTKFAYESALPPRPSPRPT